MDKNKQLRTITKTLANDLTSFVKDIELIVKIGMYDQKNIYGFKKAINEEAYKLNVNLLSYKDFLNDLNKNRDMDYMEYYDYIYEQVQNYQSALVSYLDRNGVNEFPLNFQLDSNLLEHVIKKSEKNLEETKYEEC